MISRRLFLGAVVATPPAAVPLVRTFVHDRDLEIDHVLELRDEDVLVMRIPEDVSHASRLEIEAEMLRANIWPHVLVISGGVELEVIRRPL